MAWTIPACCAVKACREKGVDCIVAPYEADAQLAYLNKCGIAQVVITEDSDLVLFGCDRVRLCIASLTFFRRELETVLVRSLFPVN